MHFHAFPVVSIQQELISMYLSGLLGAWASLANLSRPYGPGATQCQRQCYSATICNMLYTMLYAFAPVVSENKSETHDQPDSNFMQPHTVALQ